MKSKSLVAIDIGSTKVACVVGRPSAAGNGSPGVDVLGTGLAEHPMLMTTWPCNPVVLARTIEQALEEAKVTPLPDRAVVVLTHPELSHHRVTAHIDVANEPIAIRGRELSRLRAQAISQALELDRDVLLLEPLGYAGNGFENVVDPRGLVATRVRGTFQLVGVPLAVKQALTQALDAVGLELERLVYGLSAVAASCVEEPYRTKRALLIDVGGCGADLGLLHAGRLSQTRSVPWGGVSVAEAVAKACGMTMDQALSASLEGFTSPTPKIRKVVDRHLQPFRVALHDALRGEPLPDVAVVTGRGALMDGLLEWIREATRVNVVLGRHPRAKGLGDLKRQVALSPALGCLESFCAAPSSSSSNGLSTHAATPGSGRLINRLLEQTRHLLVEYF